MFIHRVNEGEHKHYGINWMISENTLFCLYLILPIWLVKLSEYKDFFTGNTYYGRQVKKLFLRLRIRRWKNFPKDTRIILYDAHTELCGMKNKTLISTYEQNSKDIKYGRI